MSTPKVPAKVTAGLRRHLADYEAELLAGGYTDRV